MRTKKSLCLKIILHEEQLSRLTFSPVQPSAAPLPCAYLVPTCSPIILGWLSNALKNDSSASFILKLHQFLRMLQLFGRGLPKVVGESGQRHVISLEVRGHGEVSVEGVELELNLLVDALLRFPVVVLTNSRLFRMSFSFYLFLLLLHR